MTQRVDLNQPLKPLLPPGQAANNRRVTAGEKPSFAKALEQAAGPELKFSSHAKQRLQSRNIELSPRDISRIEGAIQQAAAKGSRDSLILMRNLALIVSVTNRTVVTAVDGDSRQENIFTNIDSAVIL